MMLCWLNAAISENRSLQYNKWSRYILGVAARSPYNAISEYDGTGIDE